MTEKEVHKMRVQDLVQLLLAQGIEVVKLQEDLDKKLEKLDILRADNDVLKVKLNESDAQIEELKKGLDESDAYIRELEEEMASLKTDQWIELAETGSIVEAAQEITEIFQAAQREADLYLSGELQVMEDIQPARPASQAPPKRKKRNRKKMVFHTVEGLNGTEVLDLAENRINLEKEEAKPLKSDGKTSDKEEEKLEEVKLQQLETSNENSESPVAAASEDSAAGPPKDDAAGASQEPWPDEVPPKNGEGQEQPQEPWPDEGMAEGSADGAQPDSDEGKKKGFFRSLKWGKSRQKKEKAKK